MSTEQTREVLDMHLTSVRELENMIDKHEHQTAEELHQMADELTEEVQLWPERFTTNEQKEQWQEIDELRAAASWVAAEIPDHDGTTTYAESYMRDALEIQVSGRYDEEDERWTPKAVEVLISYGGPTVWISGPHGTDDDYVEVDVSWWGPSQTARTYAPHLAEHLAGILECYEVAR